MKNFINGSWEEAINSNGEWKVVSPADLKEILGIVKYSYQDVDRSVQASRDAFRTWKKLSTEARYEYLKKFAAAVESRSEDLALKIAKEVGKPLWEARTEVKSVINKVKVTFEDSLPLIAKKTILNIMPGAIGSYEYKPLGVMVVVGPFNFPAHLPNGHWQSALLTGNTVIFKPSEKAPGTAQILGECFEAAGIPAGVFQIVQGEKEVSRRLCVHEGVDGVLFTGSHEVAYRIRQDTLAQWWKMLALETGGKNVSIVCEDADLEHSLRENLISSYITAGQRCSATSRILVEKSLFQNFVDQFHAAAKRFKIGHVTEEVFMGPLIDAQAVDRTTKFIGIAARDGFEVLMRGKNFQASRPGYYMTPSIAVSSDLSLERARKSVFVQTEVFGPLVEISAFDSDVSALELANCTQYGLVASVFSKSEMRFKDYFDELQFGNINWNKGTIGASAKLPFGGLKRSGNHFPAALFAPRYSTHSVASIQINDVASVPLENPPGLT